MNRRRALALALAVLVLAAVLAPDALASAGGGASGFSGGGGGEGFSGGGGGGGKAFALYVVLRVLIDVALIGHGLGLAVLAGLLVLYLIFARLLPWLSAAARARREQGFQGARGTARRERRVALAAAEASEEDPGFDPEAVRAAAGELFAAVQAAWTRGDRIALRGMVAPGLLAEWNRRLDEFQRRGWSNHVELTEPPRVAYVGLRRGENGDERVVVRIDARLRDYVVDAGGRRMKRTGRLTETARVREFWTLARRGGRWVLAAIEQGSEGAHELSEQIVGTPWADEPALRDQALVEGATADAPAGVDPGELVSLEYDGDARGALLDLSLADPRFAPDVLLVAVRRALQGWARAVDGDTDALAGLATADGVRELLHADEGTRVVVRGARVQRVEVSALRAHAHPPEVDVEVQCCGRRYLQDRASAAVLAGSPTRERSFVERWTFALGDDPEQPWRLIHAASPLARA
jgi:predicted lipid-binding transport protein (Tim44 family)